MAVTIDVLACVRVLQMLVGCEWFVSERTIVNGIPQVIRARLGEIFVHQVLNKGIEVRLCTF